VNSKAHVGLVILKMLQNFQKQHALQTTGVVNAAPAKAINKAVDVLAPHADTSFSVLN